MRKPYMKRLVTGGLTALLTAGLILPASASAGSYMTYQTTNTTYKTVNWTTYFNSIPWNTVYTPQPVQQKPVQQQPVQQKPVQQPAKQPVQTGNQVATGTTADKSQFATQVITLVNQERAKQGLKPLTGDYALNKMALAKAQDMSQNKYFDHNSPTQGSPFDMMKSYGILYSYAGENIAMGQKTPADVVNAWMNSAGHRANILSANFNLIGVGYYNGYWAQEFVGR
ncbi:CAP domain-containing protein [Paenibacillus puldeungensis]|uniref:CAP domain-containing protein n=1 Tax=Paenibacillus puldeungensis TaxID=696536 RepID=A0ABW3S1J4_9BACL